jgi:hypothetical protein
VVIGMIGMAAEEWRRGLKMRTRTRPKMISTRRNMHFRLPVFFWYLSRVRMRWKNERI